MEYMEAMDIIGGLSTPSKMPWFSWSISAFDCKTGTKLRQIEGSVCASCYACKGNYRFRNVKEAHARRLNALDHPLFVDAFVLVLTKLYERSKKTYVKDGKTIKENRFRWHDSGDLQSLDHLRMIVEIAERCPFLDFWIPTKEAGTVAQFKKAGGKFPANLTVRLSAAMVGDIFKVQPQGLVTSSVGADSSLHNCPAYSQEGKCLDCRACWNPTVSNVNYPLH